MTKDEYTRKLHAIEKANRLWESRAADQVRMIIKSALQKWFRTGVYDTDGVNAAVKLIYESGAFNAADKTAALSEKYLTEALIGRGWKQDLSIPGRMWKEGGKEINVKSSPVAHNFPLADSVWGADEYKARAQAVVDYARANGRDIKETAQDLNLLCEKNGGKRLAKKYDRLYRVKNDDGTINDKRWREGWERDWCEANGVQFDSAKFDAARNSGQIDDWIKERAYKGNKKLMPKVHKDFIKRLGASNIDYRAARLARTEAAAAHQKTLTSIGTGKFSTGKFEIVLSWHRDAWKCACKELADACKKAGGWTLAEMAAEARKRGALNEEPPFHPNCSCVAYNIPLDVDEIARRAAEEDFYGAG